MRRKILILILIFVLCSNISIGLLGFKEGKIIINNYYDINFSSSLINASSIDQVIYRPTSFSVSTGVLDGGNLESLKYYDLDTLNVSEVGGAPGFVIHVNYTNVTSFDEVWIVYDYQGSISHLINLQLDQFQGNNLGDHAIGLMRDANELEVIAIPVYNSSLFISDNGTVHLLVDHDTSGNAGHDIFIDEILLVKLFAIALNGTSGGSGSASASGDEGYIQFYNNTNLGSSPNLLWNNTVNRFIVNGTTLLRPGDNGYLFTTCGGNCLSIQSQDPGKISHLRLMSKDGDGSDNVLFSIHGVGTPEDTTNRERLIIGYSNTDDDYHITTESSGTGANKSLHLGANGYPDMLHLQSDSTTTIHYDLDVEGNVNITNNLTVNNQILLPLGSASDPSIGFLDDDDLGIYATVGALRFTASGTNMVRMTSSGIGVRTNVIASPGLHSSSDTDTGVNWYGSNELGIGTFGKLAMFFDNIQNVNITNNLTADNIYANNLVEDGDSNGQILWWSNTTNQWIPIIGTPQDDRTIRYDGDENRWEYTEKQGAVAGDGFFIKKNGNTVYQVTGASLTTDWSFFNGNVWAGTRWTQGTDAANMIFRSARGNQTDPDFRDDGDTLGGMNVRAWRGAGSGGFGQTMARLTFLADGDHSATSVSSAISIYTTPLGATSSVEVARINRDGYFGIGTIAPSYPLTVMRNVSNITIWSEGYVSAPGYETRTSVWDESENVWDYIYDSKEYKDINGNIIHSKLAPNVLSNKVNIKIGEEIVQQSEGINVNGKQVLMFYNETVPIMEEQTFEGVLLDDIVAGHTQALWELKQENNMLKNELCQNNNNYSWCLGVIK